METGSRKVIKVNLGQGQVICHVGSVIVYSCVIRLNLRIWRD